MVTKILTLTLGSILGGLSRYFMAGLTYRWLGSLFPYGTLIVNLSGCLFIGFLSSIVEKKFLLSPNDRLLWMTGFCGAFTTFSTFMLETSNLLKDGETTRAFMNIVLSITLGFILFKFGELVGKII